MVQAPSIIHDRRPLQPGEKIIMSKFITDMARQGSLPEGLSTVLVAVYDGVMETPEGNIVVLTRVAP